jgi:hypothetical protein
MTHGHRGEEKVGGWWQEDLPLSTYLKFKTVNKAKKPDRKPDKDLSL